MSVAEFFQYLFQCPASTELAGQLVELYTDRRVRALEQLRQH